MPYSGGIIYVDDSTTPAAGVSIYDVQQALGITSRDVATLCGSSSINKWAKRKPVRLANVFVPITDAQRLSVNYGFNVTDRTGTPDSIALLPSGSGTWAYLRPVSGFPFRLSDFNGYYKYAKCPMDVSMSFTEMQNGLPVAAQIAIDSEVNGLDTQYNVLVSDIFDISAYDDYRLTLAIVDNTVEGSETVLAYYFSPYTLNDDTAMANENKIVTVRNIPSSASPVTGRLYDAVLMLTDKDNLSDSECKDGVLPADMSGVTAISLELADGNNRFQFVYGESQLVWSLDEMYIYSEGAYSADVSGSPELFCLNALYVELEAGSGDSTEVNNSQVKVTISINGSHYYWSGTSAGPDDGITRVASGATYDVTDWIQVSDFQPNVPGTSLMELSSRAKYKLTGYNQYPIFLDSDDYPTDITIHVYTRIGGSGSGTQIVGASGTISAAGDDIHIQSS